MGADGGAKGPILIDVSVCVNQLQTVPVLSLSSSSSPERRVLLSGLGGMSLPWSKRTDTL